MTRQGHLYDDSTATVRSTQGRLFDPDHVDAGDSGLTCQECGRPMVRTGSGYLVCPIGHGRLLEEIGDAERSAAWFEDDGPRWDSAGNCTHCGEAGRCQCHHVDGDCRCRTCRG